MITFVRTRSIAPGKMAEAMAYAQQVTKLVKEKYGVQINPSVPIGGNFDRIALVSSHPSLAEVESTSTKLLTDSEYMQLLAANTQTFLPGTTHDELWMSI